MAARSDADSDHHPKRATTTARVSDRELTVTRDFAHPARRVFDAWTQPTQFARWWVPRSCGFSLLSCEMDVRVDGRYRLEFPDPSGPEPLAFHGTYLEVVPHERLVWSNEEAGDAGQISTLTFDEVGGVTRVKLSERYPSREALDDAVASGSTGGMDETFAQLDEHLAASIA